MGIRTGCLFFILIFFAASVVSASVSESTKKFIKGSISDKIHVVQTVELKESIPVIEKALDFVIENTPAFGSDEDLTQLALVTVNTLPSDSKIISRIKESSQKSLSEKLMAIFKIQKDKNLRAAIMKILPAYASADKNLTVNFLNDYLSTAFKADEKAENVLEQAIVTLGTIGNQESLTIIYNIWSSKIWKEYSASTDEALVLLSQDSFTDAIKIFSVSKIEDSAHYFSLLHKSSKISQNSLCQIAETALLFAINNAEKLKASGKSAERAFFDFQKETHELLAENKWSHAYSVINSNVILAKKSFDEGKMSESDFSSLISSATAIPSHELAQTFTDMLSECNGILENNNRMPAKSVVLALISALGVLGDKTAFDTLLYVSYLSYPLDVIDEAKKSLALLQW